jgi:hypothetical protein
MNRMINLVNCRADLTEIDNETFIQEANVYLHDSNLKSPYGDGGKIDSFKCAKKDYTFRDDAMPPRLEVEKFSEVKN